MGGEWQEQETKPWPAEGCIGSLRHKKESNQSPTTIEQSFDSWEKQDQLRPGKKGWDKHGGK